MNFKPLRATLVFLFALSATACSGGTGVMPITPGASGVVATSAPNGIGTLPAAVPTLHANDICDPIQKPLLAGHFQRNDSSCSGGTGSCPVGINCGTIISPSGPPGMGPPPGWNDCMIGCYPPDPCDPNMCGPHVPNPRPILPPGLVGLQPWGTGKHCNDSIHGIDDDVPVTVSDDGHSVHDIFVIGATTKVIGGPQMSGPMGYIYVDKNGQWYMGESPSYTGNALQILSNAVPFIGQFLQGIDANGKNFDEPISLSAVQKMKADGNLGQGVSVQPCFKGVPILS